MSKSVKLGLDLFELKFKILDMKLDRVRCQVAIKYDQMLNRLVEPDEQVLDTVDSRVNQYRDGLLIKLNHELKQSLKLVDPTIKDELTTDRRLLYHKNHIDDQDIQRNLKSLLICEGVFGKMVQVKYDCMEFTKFNMFLNLNHTVINPTVLAKKKLGVKPQDFFYLNNTFLFRYIDTDGFNHLAILDSQGDVVFSKKFSQNKKTNFFAVNLDNEQEKIYVLQSRNNFIKLEVYSFRLSLIATYKFPKFKVEQTVEQTKREVESHLWNFGVSKNELLLSFRLEVRGLFDLYYLLYEFTDNSVRLKLMISSERLNLLKCRLNYDYLTVSKASCLIYFSQEFFYFINHDSESTRYLEVVYRNHDKEYLTLNKLMLDDSYEFFFDSKNKQFIAYNTERRTGLCGSRDQDSLSRSNNRYAYMYEGGDDENEPHDEYDKIFRFSQYAFDGHCLSENCRVEMLYSMIKHGFFKVYFKNALNMSLANLFREYFAFKLF